MAEDSNNIKVVVRCRPLNARELNRGAAGLIRMHGTTTTLLPPDPGTAVSSASRLATEREPKTFTYDKSYDSSGSRRDPEYASQQTLYEDLGIDLLNHAFAGYNATIFAYGQTGSGKSYSMMGYGDDRGVIPLTCFALFSRIQEQTTEVLSFNVEVSYLEIYQERVRDLLNPKGKGSMRVREHPSLGPYVEDLSKLAVTDFADIERLMDEGNKSRTVGSTQMNDTSSRSHAIFTVMLTQRRIDEATGIAGEKVSRISLVDLAGSERANSTGATGIRLKEGAQINKSLTTLGKVIAALAQAGSRGNRAEHVPYRDSVLTWLLKDSLGGNSKTAMIAAISPADYEETLSTLRYADQAKRIKNRAVVNEDPNARLIRELKEELQMLRSRVRGDGSEAFYDPSVPPEQQLVHYMTKNGEMRTVTKAELQDQLEASEKLMAEAAQTWEEKLARTEEVHRHREAALESVGIVIEKNLLGVQTPKKVPHLVNLAEDPLADGCLVYILRPHKTTVGNMDAQQAIDIRLSGDSVMPLHAYFEALDDGMVQLVALSDSTTLVNGKLLRSNEPHLLKTGYRIIFGWHAFRYSNPEEVRRTRQRSNEIGTPDGIRTPLRALATNDSPLRRSGSPAPPPMDGEEVDWSFARREAIMAKLGGQSVDLDTLQDDDLDALYGEITRARRNRRAVTASMMLGGRDSRLSSYQASEDGDSSGSTSGQPFSQSTWTDDTSLGDARRLETSSETNENLHDVKKELEAQSEEPTVGHEQRAPLHERSTADGEELRFEHMQMEERLVTVQREMQNMLEEQRRHYEDKVQELTKQTSRPSLRPQEWAPLSKPQMTLASRVIAQWRSLTRVKMAEQALTHAVLVKEVNVIARELGKRVSYQLTILDEPPSVSPAMSAIEDVIGMTAADDRSDAALDQQRRPCIACKVIDREHRSIYFWSLSRLASRLATMRGLYSYVDMPQSAQHLSWDEPFFTNPAPKFTHLGTILVSLSPLARCLPSSVEAVAFSRLTGWAVAHCRVTLKPTSLLSPEGVSLPLDRSASLEAGCHLSFEVTVDHCSGLSSDEMESLHCQIDISAFIGDSMAPDVVPSSPFTVEMDGSTELRFHQKMAATVDSDLLERFTTHFAPIELFIRATSNHLERLEAWDFERETQAKVAAAAAATEVSAGRRNELELMQEQQHDVVASIEICELASSGRYEPVPLVASNPLDTGAFYLRQGLQRRLSVNLSHTSGRAWSWRDISNVRLGDVRMLDARGRVHHASISGSLIPLHALSKPSAQFDSDGTSVLSFTAPWDSSLHDSPFLDRPTSSASRALLRLAWQVDLPNSDPADFETDFGVSVHARDAGGPIGFMGGFFSSSKVYRKCSTLFSVRVVPAMVKRSADLWRHDTSKVRVRGEEGLGKNWLPRGVSLINDHERLIRRERHLARVAAVRSILASIPPSRLVSPSAGEDEDEKLQSAVTLWLHRTGPLQQVRLIQDPTLAMTLASLRSADMNPREPSMIATVDIVPRSTPVSLRAPLRILRDPSSGTWSRRFAVLRRPYLYLYEDASETSEVAVINTSRIRVASSSEMVEMLGRPHVFAIYAATMSLFVQAESAAASREWQRALDISMP